MKTQLEEWDRLRVQLIVGTAKELSQIGRTTSDTVDWLVDNVLENAVLASDGLGIVVTANPETWKTISDARESDPDLVDGEPRSLGF